MTPAGFSGKHLGKASFARFLRLEKEVNLQLVGLRVEELSRFGGRHSELAWTGMEQGNLSPEPLSPPDRGAQTSYLKRPSEGS